MKLKEGLSALAVAALLASPLAFAQQQEAEKKLESSQPETQVETTTGEGPTPGHTSLEDPTQREETTAAVEEEAKLEQQADASSSMREERDSSFGSQQSAAVGQDSAEQQDSQQGTAWGQAAADVPPPVDSETVRSIQQALSEQGQQVRADGIWGEKTHQALMQFQRDNNLDASGQIDAETMAALNLMDQQQTASADQQEQQQTAQEQQQAAQEQQQAAQEQQQAALEEQQSPSAQPQSSQ